MTTDTAVLDRLTDLGDTADQVAQALFELGIRGYPGSSIACPVATWLEQCYPGHQWAVSSAETHALSDKNVIIKNPAQVTQFIEAFDLGKYADLYPYDYGYSTFLAESM
jgi:hypothetical protein